MDHIEFSRRLDDATVDLGVLMENRFKALEITTNRLLTEIENWKDASGLERGGDPDSVTPDDLRNELALLKAVMAFKGLKSVTPDDLRNELAHLRAEVDRLKELLGE